MIFYYNGIKINKGGALIKCFYTLDSKNRVNVYSEKYGKTLPDEIGEVKNDTDSLEDYFDKDRTNINPDSRFYQDALKALIKQEEKEIKKYVRRNEKRGYLNDEYYIKTRLRLEANLDYYKSLL